jgi:very-short-patch-repair endonuclease
MENRRPKIALARRFRRELTPPETRLWVRLKDKPDGIKFRRQHPAGPYILDFYCPHIRLAIEVDGEAHNLLDVAIRDERRDSWLKAQGYEVMRVPAAEVMADTEEVVTGLLAFVSERIARGK